MLTVASFLCQMFFGRYYYRFRGAIGNETNNFRNFKSSISLRSSHQLNVNEASGFLRTFLCGDNDYGLEDLEAFLSGEGAYGGEEGQGRYFQSPNDPKLQMLKGRGIDFGVDCKAFRLKVTVSRGKSKFVLWAILEDLTGGSASTAATTLTPQAQEAKKRFDALKYPFKILALRENENFID